MEASSMTSAIFLKLIFVKELFKEVRIDLRVNSASQPGPIDQQWKQKFLEE
jgi:hypothetical protein